MGEDTSNRRPLLCNTGDLPPIVCDVEYCPYSIISARDALKRPRKSPNDIQTLLLYPFAVGVMRPRPSYDGGRGQYGGGGRCSKADGRSARRAISSNSLVSR